MSERRHSEDVTDEGRVREAAAASRVMLGRAAGGQRRDERRDMTRRSAERASGVLGLATIEIGLGSRAGSGSDLGLGCGVGGCRDE